MPLYPRHCAENKQFESVNLSISGAYEGAQVLVPGYPISVKILLVPCSWSGNMWQDDGNSRN